jgi:hypothetical protein
MIVPRRVRWLAYFLTAEIDATAFRASMACACGRLMSARTLTLPPSRVAAVSRAG